MVARNEADIMSARIAPVIARSYLIAERAKCGEDAEVSRLTKIDSFFATFRSLDKD